MTSIPLEGGKPYDVAMVMHPEVVAQWQQLAGELREHLEWLERGDMTTRGGSPYDAEEGLSRLRTSVGMFDDIIAAHGGAEA